jgi:hypothetical protein
MVVHKFLRVVFRGELVRAATAQQHQAAASTEQVR